MKKKLIKYAIDLANSADLEHGGFAGVFQYCKDGRFFVSDGHRLLETETIIDELPLKCDSKMVQRMIDIIDLVNEREYDYQRYDLPTVSKIKEGIRSVCGRKLDRVIWSDGTVTMNARWLYKAMEALNATKALVSTTKSRTMAIFLCENDDPMSINRVMIMPISNNGRVGYWTV